MAELLAALDGVVASLKGEQRGVDAGTGPISAAQTPFQALLSARRAEIVAGAMSQWVAGVRVDRSPSVAQPPAWALGPGLRARPPDAVAVDTAPGTVANTAAYAAQRAAAATDVVVDQSRSDTSMPKARVLDVDAEPQPAAAVAVWALIDARGWDGLEGAGTPALSDAPALDPKQPVPDVAAGRVVLDGMHTPAIPAPSGQPLPAGVRVAGAEALPSPPLPGASALAAAGGIAATDTVTADSAAPLPLAGAPETRLNAGDDASPGVQGARALESVVRTGETRVQLTLETPLRGQAFAAELGEKLVWLAGRQGQWAALSLNPPHLGNIEVRLTLAAGEASAQFFSAHPAVRDALEAALPRLRELMAGAGIQLGDAQVRDQAFSSRDDAPRFVAAPVAGAGLGASPAGESTLRYQAGTGLIDLYA